MTDANKSPHPASPATDTPAAAPLTPTATPGIARRLAALGYEALLLSCVIVVFSFVVALVAQRPQVLQGRTGAAFLFALPALYFVWFWSHGGQTVAMRAWHIRLVDVHGQPVRWTRALGRYVLAWAWFAPAAAVSHVLAFQGLWAKVAALAVGVLVYAALARLRPDHQFWHDAACGTRLVMTRPVPQPKAQSAA